MLNTLSGAISKLLQEVQCVGVGVGVWVWVCMAGGGNVTRVQCGQYVGGSAIVAARSVEGERQCETRLSI